VILEADASGSWIVPHSGECSYPTCLLFSTAPCRARSTPDRRAVARKAFAVNNLRRSRARVCATCLGPIWAIFVVASASGPSGYASRRRPIVASSIVSRQQEVSRGLGSGAERSVFAAPDPNCQRAVAAYCDVYYCTRKQNCRQGAPKRRKSCAANTLRGGARGIRGASHRLGAANNCVLAPYATHHRGRKPLTRKTFRQSAGRATTPIVAAGVLLEVKHASLQGGLNCLESSQTLCHRPPASDLRCPPQSASLHGT